MELKASFYIKACKRVRDMLRSFPSIKQTLTLKERQKLTVDLAKYLQRKAEESESAEEDCYANVCTKEEFCRHCEYQSYLGGKQVICKATGKLISGKHRGRCKHFKEGYKNY